MICQQLNKKIINHPQNHQPTTQLIRKKSKNHPQKCENVIISNNEHRNIVIKHTKLRIVRQKPKKQGYYVHGPHSFI